MNTVSYEQLLQAGYTSEQIKEMQKAYKGKVAIQGIPNNPISEKSQELLQLMKKRLEPAGRLYKKYHEMSPSEVPAVNKVPNRA